MKIYITQPRNNSKYPRGRTLIYAAFAMALFCGSVSAEMRIWEDTSGISVKAEFIRELFGSVELRRPNGGLHSIPLENLSKQDAEYVSTRIPPEIELTVRKKKQGKVRNKDFMRDGDIINVVTVETQVAKKSRVPFSGVLRAEVYLVGKEIEADIYRLSGRGNSRVQFTKENQGMYEFQTSADFRVYEEYNDLEVRGAEYAGYLVVVMDSMGNKLASQTDLSWLKNEKIDALRKLPIDSFFDENCRKHSVPRPLYYDSRFGF